MTTTNGDSGCAGAGQEVGIVDAAEVARHGDRRSQMQQARRKQRPEVAERAMTASLGR